MAELKTEVPATKHYVLDDMQRIVGETRRELATTKRQHESAVASNQLLTGRLAKFESQLSETNERLRNTKSTMESLRRAKDEYETQAKELDLWFSMLQEIVENSLPKLLYPDEESAVRFFLPDEFKKACPADIWKDLEELSHNFTSLA